MAARTPLIALTLALCVYAQPAPAQEPAVEPEALQALQRMKAYLSTLTAFQLTSETSVDLVMVDGQKVQLNGLNTYKVRRPNGFAIEATSDRKVRRYVYDGKSFTVEAPKIGYYSTVAAPPTIREMLDAVSDRYGIELPLEDLFRWNQPGDEPRQMQSGVYVGEASVDGTATDHYAFREEFVDWQVWIQKGPQPLPRKLVIVDRTDAAYPQYTARLRWNTKPAIDAKTFAFRPAPGAKAIEMAAQ